jgi:formylglycine-generating enzyme
MALTPSGMAPIPSGSFTMGDAFYEGGLPTNTVYLSAYYMDRTEVTKALWDEVYAWAINHDYQFDNAGMGKATNHPVQMMSWYDAVKWCNARSEKASRVPAYYTDAAQTTVYRTGQVNVQNDWVKWNVGYRLPTDAEWEKAARGGATGHRFPWSDADTVTHSQANYKSSTDYPYDISPTRGFHPAFSDDVQPYTSPVGFFAPNGYGLYDMAGNVFEWCWDWAGYLGGDAQSDPRGPTKGSLRLARSGSWVNVGSCRIEYRGCGTPSGRESRTGFRCVLPSGQ